METTAFNSSPTFRGSYTANPELRIYPQRIGEDAIILKSSIAPSQFGEGYLGTAMDLTGIQTSQDMNGSSMSATFRTSVHFNPTEFDARVGVGDWFDLLFWIDQQSYHVMRGRIISITRSKFADGSGASGFVVSINGRGFESCLSETEIFADIFLDKSIAPIIWGLIATSLDSGNIILDHAETVTAALYGYLHSQSQEGRSLWTLPETMPRLADTLASELLLPHMIEGGYGEALLSRTPKRVSYLALNLRNPTPFGQSVWTAVSSWADPEVCDLFPTLVQTNGLPLGEGPSSLNDTRMAIVYRDKPFIGSERHFGWLDAETDSEAPRVTTFRIDTRDIRSMQSGRSINNLVNMVYVTPQVPNGFQMLFRYLTRPAINVASMAAYGARKKEVLTPYLVIDADNPTNPDVDILVSDAYRARIVELNVLNHILESGSIDLAKPRFDLRVGQRLVLSGEFDADAHIDSVSHNWQVGSTHTNVGLSRIWYGTAGEQKSFVKETLREFTVVRPSPTETTSSDPTIQAILDRISGASDQPIEDEIGPAWPAVPPPAHPPAVTSTPERQLEILDRMNP